MKMIDLLPAGKVLAVAAGFGLAAHSCEKGSEGVSVFFFIIAAALAASMVSWREM